MKLTNGFTATQKLIPSRQRWWREIGNGGKVDGERETETAKGRTRVIRNAWVHWHLPIVLVVHFAPCYLLCRTRTRVLCTCTACALSCEFASSILTCVQVEWWNARNVPMTAALSAGLYQSGGHGLNICACSLQVTGNDANNVPQIGNNLESKQ